MKIFFLYTLIFFTLFVYPNCDKENYKSQNDSIIFLLKNIEDKKNSFEKRVFLNKKAFSLLLNRKNDSLTRVYIFKVVENFYTFNDWERLKKSTKELYDKSSLKNDLYHSAFACRYFGLMFENMSRNDSAYYYYDKAEKLFLKRNNQHEICVIYQDKALIQYYTNNFSDSEYLLIKALRIANKLQLPNEAYRIYISLALNAREQNNYENALEYFQKSMTIIKERKVNFHDYHYEYCLNNIGYIYILKKDFITAKNLFLTALKNKKISSEPIIYSRLIDNFCKVNLELRQFSQVKGLLDKTYSQRKKLNISEGQNFNRLYLSEYYAAIKDTANAKKYADEAYAISENFKAPNDMLLCLKHLAKIDPKDALKYSSQYIKISDSMHQLERETRNKFAKIAYETEEIIQEKNTAEKQKTIFLGTTITVIAFGLLLLIIVGQRIRQKELLFAQSQQKAKEEIYQLIHVQQSKIDEGRQIEKKRIARDLHDGIMNKLASTRFNLHILNTKTDKETIKSCIAHIDGIHEIEKEIRNISHDLNKEVFSENDSFKRILVTFFEEQKKIMKAKLHTDIDKSIDWDSLKSSQKINLYRMLQEVFQNAGKHAKADHLFLSMSNQDNYILLEIHDDGIGFSVNDKNKGIGLQNLRARAKDCQGIFHINSTVGSGTTIIVSIPTSKENLA